MYFIFTYYKTSLIDCIIVGFMYLIHSYNLCLVIGTVRRLPKMVE